jgi:hypothetical protein
MKRGIRLVRHLQGKPHSLRAERAAYPTGRAWHFLETLFLLIDCFYIPEIALLLNKLIKRNTRPMHDREIELAQSVFGNSIDYRKVRMDERARIGCRRHHFAYVGFNCINSWGALSEPHFIHELMHVWQYQRFGSVYIPRALYAQRTPEAYDYGGIEAIREAAMPGKGLLDFNWEQQAEIVSDYFCLLNGWKPRWCTAKPEYAPVFEAVLRGVWEV